MTTSRRIHVKPVENADELALWSRIIGPCWRWGEPPIDEAAHLRALEPSRIDLVAWYDDQPAGAATMGPLPGQPGSGIAVAAVWVAPDLRRRRIGSELDRAVCSRARQQERTVLQVECYEDDPASIAYLCARGFEEIERNCEVALDLASLSLPEPDPPAGVAIVRLADAPHLIRGMYDVALEAIPDIPGVEAGRTGSFEDWRARDVEQPKRPRELCFVATYRGEVVGYALLQVGPAGIAFHGLTGVKRAFRRRGIASALKRTQIRAAKLASFTRLVTESVEANAAVQHLNRKYGYRPLPGSIVWRGPLTG